MLVSCLTSGTDGSPSLAEEMRLNTLGETTSPAQIKPDQIVDKEPLREAELEVSKKVTVEKVKLWLSQPAPKTNFLYAQYCLTLYKILL